MASASTQLLFPVAYWDGPVPMHEITSIVRGPRFMITGSATGELCYWKAEASFPDESGAARTLYSPNAMMMREGASKCTALAKCQFGGNDIIVTATSEGCLAVWAASGGRCYQSRALLPFAANKLHVFLRDGETFLICVGNYHEVHIVLLANEMRVVNRLPHRRPVVDSCLSPDTYSSSPYLFTFTAGGVLNLWDLNEQTSAQRLGATLSQDPSAEPRPSAHHPSSSASSSSAPRPSVNPLSHSLSAFAALSALAQQSVMGGQPASSAAQQSQAPASLSSLPPPSPAHSVRLLHMPSQPSGLAVSPDGSRVIILLQKHWLSLSLVTFRQDLPLCFKRRPRRPHRRQHSSHSSISSSPESPAPLSPHAPSRSSRVPNSHLRVDTRSALSTPSPSSSRRDRAAAPIMAQKRHQRNVFIESDSSDNDDDRSVSSAQPPRNARVLSLYDCDSDSDSDDAVNDLDGQSAPVPPHISVFLGDDDGDSATNSSSSFTNPLKLSNNWSGIAFLSTPEHYLQSQFSSQAQSAEAKEGASSGASSASPSPAPSPYLQHVVVWTPRGDIRVFALPVASAVANAALPSARLIARLDARNITRDISSFTAEQSMPQSQSQPHPSPSFSSSHPSQTDSHFNFNSSSSRPQPLTASPTAAALLTASYCPPSVPSTPQTSSAAVSSEKSTVTVNPMPTQVTVLVDGFSVLCGTESGRLFEWWLDPSRLSSLTAQRIACHSPTVSRSLSHLRDAAHSRSPSAHRHALPPSLSPDAEMGLAQGFPALLDPQERANPCTCSVLLKESGWITLARGFQWGQITVARMLAGSRHRPMELLGHRREVVSMIGIDRSESVLARPLLVSGSKDHTVRIWNLNNGRVMGKFQLPSSVVGLYWHPPSSRPRPELEIKEAKDGKHLVLPEKASLPPGESGDLVFVSCEDQAVRVLSIMGMTQLQTLRCHDSPVQLIIRDDWCIAADLVITQTKKGTVYVWVLTNGELERVLEANSDVCERFLNGRRLLGDRTDKAMQAITKAKRRGLFSFRRRKHEEEHQPSPSSASFSALPGTSASHSSSLSLSGPQLGSSASTDSFFNGHSASSGPLASTVRVVPMQGVSHLHLTLYVLNINQLLNELHKRYATLSLGRAIPPSSASSSATSAFASPRSSSRNPGSAMAQQSSKHSDGDENYDAMFGMLSILFDWGADQEIDRILTTDLLLDEPQPLPSFGVVTDNGRALTLLLPANSLDYRPLGRWEHDAQFSARHALCLSTVCMSLLSTGDPLKQAHFSRIVSHYNVILPDAFPRYVEPDVTVLASFALNRNEELYTVARLLLQGVVERSSTKQRLEIVRRWSALYNYPLTRVDMSDDAAPTANTMIPMPHKPDESSPVVTTASGLPSSSAATSSPMSSPLISLSSDFDPSSSSLLPPPIVSTVVDHELMTALVLCLIAVFNASQRDYRLRMEMDEREKESKMQQQQQQPRTDSPVPSTSSRHVGDYSHFEGGAHAGSPVSAVSTLSSSTSAPSASSSAISVSASSTRAAPAEAKRGVGVGESGGDGDEELGEEDVRLVMSPAQAYGGVPDGDDVGAVRVEDEAEVEVEDEVSKQRREQTRRLQLLQQQQQMKQRREKEEMMQKQQQHREKSLRDEAEMNEILSSKAEYIIHTLLRVLAPHSKYGGEEADDVKMALAADLLGKGFSMWREHLTDQVVPLIRRLHVLATTRQGAVASAAHRALLETGRVLPKHFVTCMGQEAQNGRADSRCRSAALITISALVRKYPEALASVLPSAVQIITRCLDPGDPKLRKSLLKSATTAFHMLVQKYPMVDFHQKSQRFAVGTGPVLNSTIVIYDLRTATKWRILEGHTGSVSAIAFNPKGNLLVSYAADEDPPTLRAWNTGVTGFFSSLLGIQGKCIKIHKLPKVIPTRQTQSLSRRMQTIKIAWISDTSVKLVREDHSTLPFNMQ